MRRALVPNRPIRFPGSTAAGARSPRNFVKGPIHQTGIARLQNLAGSEPGVFERGRFQQFRQPVGLQSHIVVEDGDPIGVGRFDPSIHGGRKTQIPSQP